jgi:hypothetical protein
MRGWTRFPNLPPPKGVRYLIVGGYAVSFHGQPRATKDSDLLIKADPHPFVTWGREPGGD